MELRCTDLTVFELDEPFLELCDLTWSSLGGVGKLCSILTNWSRQSGSAAACYLLYCCMLVVVKGVGLVCKLLWGRGRTAEVVGVGATHTTASSDEPPGGIKGEKELR